MEESASLPPGCIPMASITSPWCTECGNQLCIPQAVTLLGPTDHCAAMSPPTAASWSGRKRAHPGEAIHEQARDFEDAVGDLPDGDLPEVDDLEVAALAALAVPEWLRAGAQAAASSSETESSEETSDLDSSEAVTPAAPKPVTAAAEAPAPQAAMQCNITPQGVDHVRVTLVVQAAASQVEVDEPSDDESEVFDANQLQDIVDAMHRVAPDEDDDPTSALHTKRAVPALDVTFSPADQLIPVGTIASCFDGMIVVKAQPGRLLEEGSVLCLAHDKLLGRVDELFGPVEAPMYSLQYAGGGEIPSEATSGSKVLAVQRLSTLLDACMAQQRGRAVEDLEGEEVEFSDDDAEAAYRATQAGDYRDNDLGLAASFAGDGPAMAVAQAPGRGGRGRRGRGPPSRGGRSQDHGRSPSRGRSGGRGGRGCSGPPAQQQQQMGGQERGQQHWGRPTGPPNGHFGGADAQRGPGGGGGCHQAQPHWQQGQQHVHQQPAPAYGQPQMHQGPAQGLLMAMPPQYQSMPGQLLQTSYPGFGIPNSSVPSLAYGQVPAAVNAAYGGQPSRPSYAAPQPVQAAGSFIPHGGQTSIPMPAGQYMTQHMGTNGSMMQQGQMAFPQQHSRPPYQQYGGRR